MASLPPEIWLQVFPNLRNNDLRSASLVSSDFRYLAQPLIFAVLDVSPFFLSYNADRPVRRPQSYLERHVERLAVYQRPHIIHGVRHCWISPYSRHGFPERSHLDDLDPCLVINHLINALHTFPNLRTLSWHCIDITPEWWLSLHALRLRKLWINSSLITPSDSNDSQQVDLPPLPSITHLDLDQWPWEGQVTNHVSIHEERAQGIDLNTLRLIIHPESTHSISVPRVDTACRLLTTLSAALHDLRTLRIPFCSLASPDFVPALEQCGNLRTLSVLPPSPDERARTLRLPEIPEHVVPNLVAYEGPCINVLDFATTRALERLSLWGFDQLPVLCDPVPLSETLVLLETQTPCVKSLRSLQVVVMCVDRALLSAVAGFEGLEEVFIQSQDSSSSNSGGVRRMPSSTHLPGSNMPVSNLYALLLSTSFPTTLRRLKLDTRLNGTKLSLEHQEQDAAQFMESFASQNACLRKVEIAYGVYWTGIYTAIWGRLRPNHSSKKDKGKSRQHCVPHTRRNDHGTLGGFNGYEVPHRHPLSPSPSTSGLRQPSSSSTSPIPVLASPVSLPNLNRTSRSTQPHQVPSPNHLAPPAPLSRAPTETETSTHIAQEAITGYSTSKSSSRHCLMSTVVSSVHPGYLGRLVFTVHRRTILFPPSGNAGHQAGVDGRTGGEAEGGGDEGTKYVRRSASRSPGRMGRVLRERRSFGLFGSVNAGTSANLNWHGKEEGYLASFWGRVKRMFGVLH